MRLISNITRVILRNQSLLSHYKRAVFMQIMLMIKMTISHMRPDLKIKKTIALLLLKVMSIKVNHINRRTLNPFFESRLSSLKMTLSSLISCKKKLQAKKLKLMKLIKKTRCWKNK